MREKLRTFASDIFINFIFNLTQFDKTKNVYYIDYAKTKASAHVTMTGMKMNQDYDITKGSITISFSGNKVKVLNERTFGHQPFPLLGTFEGTK